MRPRHRQSLIRPKISTMPRPQTEAATYLDIYKLVNEKKRLQQEFGTLEERRERIQDRIAEITAEIANLEVTAHQLRDRDEAEATNPTPVTPKPSHPVTSDNFKTLYLEY
jgi:predicted  nucleic acid-binding Zn-ribbon protein